MKFFNVITLLVMTNFIFSVTHSADPVVMDDVRRVVLLANQAREKYDEVEMFLRTARMRYASDRDREMDQCKRFNTAVDIAEEAKKLAKSIIENKSFSENDICIAQKAFDRAEWVIQKVNSEWCFNYTME